MPPVVIALDQIDETGGVRFHGIDVETGARVCIHIEQTDRRRPAKPAEFDAQGLILVISVERFEPTN